MGCESDCSPFEQCFLTLYLLSQGTYCTPERLTGHHLEKQYTKKCIYCTSFCHLVKEHLIFLLLFVVGINNWHWITSSSTPDYRSWQTGWESLLYGKQKAEGNQQVRIAKMERISLPTSKETTQGICTEHKFILPCAFRVGIRGIQKPLLCLWASCRRRRTFPPETKHHIYKHLNINTMGLYQFHAQLMISSYEKID